MKKDFSYAKVLLRWTFGLIVCTIATQMSVAWAPQITIQVLNSALPSGVHGVAYQAKLYASGGTGPYTWALLPGSALPTGTLFQFTSGGVLSGTPTTTGSYNIVVQATDANGKQGSRSYTLTISNSGITTTSLSSGIKGVAYNATLAATGGAAPYSWTIAPGQPGKLPSGLSMSTSGVISGTPGTLGYQEFMVRATDSRGQRFSQTLGINTVMPLTVSGSSLPTGTIGRSYKSALGASGGQAPYTWKVVAGTPPSIIGVDTTGTVSGTPTETGSYGFTVQASDVSGQQVNASASIAITGLLAITTTSLPSGKVGALYSSNLAASGGLAPYSWNLTGGLLPPGLTLTPLGGISGTPATAGSFTFTLQVLDSGGGTSSQTYTVSMAAATAPVSITTTSLPNGTVGTAYSSSVSATGGTSPYTWAVSAGALPAGLVLSNGGGISGTPTAAGSATFTLKVTDSAGGTSSHAYTVSIASVVVITTTSLPSGKTGVAYSATLAATGGTAPYTWSIAAGLLPAGVGLGTGTGTISGTPTTAGTYTVTVQAVDSAGQVASKALSFVIAASLSITTTSIPNATAGVVYNATLVTSGGTPPVTWAVSSGQLPTGLSLSSSGSITGTPSSAGSFTFVAQATDSAAGTASQSYPLVVSAPGTGGATIIITNADLPNGTVGTAYAATLAATGGTAPYTWSIVSGALPAGLTLNGSTGAISGTPTTVGWSNLFTVQVADSAGSTGSLAYSVIINPVLDLYGGLVGKACAATGAFHTQKIGARWWFCSPLGNVMWMIAMGGANPGGSYTDPNTGQTSAYDSIATAKYGDSSGSGWGAAQLRRLRTWGFNTIGQISMASVAIGPNGLRLPRVVPIWTYRSTFNDGGYAAGPSKDLTWGVPPTYKGFRNPSIDFFDANVWTWLSGNILNADGGALKTAINDPWTLGVVGDDQDWAWGFGAGPDFHTIPAGHTNPNFGWWVAVTSPQQTFNPASINGGPAQLYSDTKVYSKAAAASPAPTDCSIANPCSLRDYLKLKYASISNLNSAWNSTYTTFDSSGTTVTETIGTGDGAKTRFPIATAHAPISPLSIKILEGGTAQGGDHHCDWTGDASCHTATLEGPSATTLQAGTPIWLRGLLNQSNAGYPHAGYQARIVYHYPNSSHTSSVSRSVDDNIAADHQPIVQSPGPDPYGATGYDVYVACQLYDTSTAAFGCAGSGDPFPALTLQVSNIDVNTNWGVPARGLVLGSALPGDPSWIDYTTGIGQVTFSAPPPTGQSIQITYTYNGWRSGGTGVMDEDGARGAAWIGTNPYCLTAASSCDGSDNPVANANSNTAADLNAWAKQFSAQYHKQFRSVLNSYNPKIPFMGIDTEGGWGAPPSKEILQGGAPYVDMLFPSITPAADHLNYMGQWFGDKPYFMSTFLAATADSALFRYPGVTAEASSQEVRGQQYLNLVQQYLSYADPTTLSNTIVGVDWWGLTDFFNGFEVANWGLVSLNDNPYDGKSACTANRIDLGGFSTGGEESIPSWKPNTPYSTRPGSNSMIQVNIFGVNYMFTSVAGGISGVSQPIWSSALNSVVTDGGINWQNIGAKSSAGCYGNAIDPVKQANSSWYVLATQ